MPCLLKDGCRIKNRRECERVSCETHRQRGGKAGILQERGKEKKRKEKKGVFLTSAYSLLPFYILIKTYL